MGRQATEVREAEPARLAAQRMDAGRRPPVAEWTMVDGGRTGQTESVTARSRPGGFVLDDGVEAEWAGAHVRAL